MLLDLLPRMREEEMWWVPWVLSEIATAHWPPHDRAVLELARTAVRRGIPVYVDLLWHANPAVTIAAADLLSAFPEDAQLFQRELIAAVGHEPDPVNAAKVLDAVTRCGRIVRSSTSCWHARRRASSR